MNLKKFRIVHSTLIENYQYIEAHLEGIYASISGKPFKEGLKEVVRGSLSDVIREIKEVEEERKVEVFTDDEYRQLRQIIERRNFWCHCCYCEITFDRKSGSPANAADVQKLQDDLRTARHWRDRLFHKKMDIFEKKWKI